MKLNEMKERFEQNIGDGIFEKQVLSALSECEDIMPRGMCADLDVPQGSTYKQGVASILNLKSDVEHLLEADRAAGL